VSRLKITQTKSAVSRLKNQRRTLRALGLRRIGDSVEHDEKPEILGMVTKVNHLVRVEHIKDKRS
jgi:large subunit ribosomal protein L30